jgi:hypothetical protein
MRWPRPGGRIASGALGGALVVGTVVFWGYSWAYPTLWGPAGSALVVIQMACPPPAAAVGGWWRWPGRRRWPSLIRPGAARQVVAAPGLHETSGPVRT